MYVDKVAYSSFLQDVDPALKEFLRKQPWTKEGFIAAQLCDELEEEVEVFLQQHPESKEHVDRILKELREGEGNILLSLVPE